MGALRGRIERLERADGSGGLCRCLDSEGYSWERALARLAGTLGPPVDDAGNCTACGLRRLEFDWAAAIGRKAEDDA